jgi:hypothetical protein
MIEGRKAFGGKTTYRLIPLQEVRMRAFAILTFVTVFGAFAFVSNGQAQPATLKWEAVEADVPTGNNVRLDLRVVGADGKPVTSRITVTSTRFDMGPDKMETMTAPVRVVPSSQPGMVSFDATVTAPGHWALTVGANVAGQTQPVSGKVIFTATRP